MDQCILFLELGCCNGSFCHLELTAVYSLDHSLLCGKQKLLKRDLLCVTDRHNLFFTAAVIAHIVNRNAFIPESSIWQIHHFDLMHFSGIRKQTDFSGIQTIYNIFILTVCRLFVSLIHTHIHCFRIPEAIHQKDHFLLFYFLFFKHCRLCIFNRSTALSSILFFKCIQLFHDQRCHGIIMIQNIFIAGNIFQRCLVFFLQRFNFQTNQFIQPHFQNCRCLSFRKPEHSRHLFRNLRFKLDVLCDSLRQTCFGIFDRLASPQNLNDQIDHVTGFDQTFLHFFFIQFFCEKRFVFSRGQLKLKIHMMLNDRL